LIKYSQLANKKILYKKCSHKKRRIKIKPNKEARNKKRKIRKNINIINTMIVVKVEVQIKIQIIKKESFKMMNKHQK
jgi:hypothetical protein